MHGVAHRFAAASSDGVGDDDVRAESDADEQVEDESGDGRVGATAATAAVPSDWEKLPTIMMPDALKSCSRMPVAATGSANRRTFVHMRPCSMSMPCLLCTTFLPPPAAAGSSFASEGIVVAAPNEGTAMPFCRML